MRILLIALFLATPALSQTRPADLDRLDRYDALLGQTLAGALAEGTAQDVDILTEVMHGRPLSGSPVGEWRCRTIKMGELLPIVVYGNFACTIKASDTGFYLEKTTGSQRLQGDITLEGNRAIYRGVGYVDGGPSRPYNGLPPDDQTPVEPGQTHAQVGYFEQMSPNRARLMLPDPILESAFDILYLTR